MVAFLVAEGLLTHDYGNQVSITQPGIVEVERSREMPNEPTAHFPPQVNVYFAGDVANSPIQIATHASSQAVSFSQTDLEASALFVAEFRRVLGDLPLPAETKVLAQASLSAAETQIASPHGDHRAHQHSRRSPTDRVRSRWQRSL